MPTDPPGLSAHPISFTIQIPPPQPCPGPCEWAHSTTWTFPCSQEDFSPSLSAGKKSGQHLGITLPCQCPTAPCPHTQGGESTIHCIPSRSHPLQARLPSTPHWAAGLATTHHVCATALGPQGLLQMVPAPALAWAGLDTLARPLPAKSWVPARGQERTAPNGNSALAKPGSTSDPVCPWQRSCSSFLSHFFSAA